MKTIYIFVISSHFGLQIVVTMFIYLLIPIKLIDRIHGILGRLQAGWEFETM